jgi:hypothetical protein
MAPGTPETEASFSRLELASAAESWQLISNAFEVAR